MKTLMKFHDVDCFEKMPEFGFNSDGSPFPLAIPRIGEFISNSNGRKRRVIEVQYDYNHVVHAYEVGGKKDVNCQLVLVTVGDESR